MQIPYRTYREQLDTMLPEHLKTASKCDKLEYLYALFNSDMQKVLKTLFEKYNLPEKLAEKIRGIEFV